MNMNNIKVGNLICSKDNKAAYAITAVDESGITVSYPGTGMPYHVGIEDLKSDYESGMFKVFVPAQESIKRYIVTAVDTGDTCDGKARVIGTFKTREEAKNYVTEAIKEWTDERASDAVEVDFDRKSAHYIDDKWDTDTGCEWNIEEVEIKL